MAAPIVRCPATSLGHPLPSCVFSSSSPSSSPSSSWARAGSACPLPFSPPGMRAPPTPAIAPLPSPAPLDVPVVSARPCRAVTSRQGPPGLPTSRQARCTQATLRSDMTTPRPSNRRTAAAEAAVPAQIVNASISSSNSESNSSNNTAKLQVTQLSRYEPGYGQVLDSVSFTVHQGQLFGLIGPSGSGKSTLLRALNRLWEPPRGCVFLDGGDVRDLAVQQLRVRVGMVFQTPNLFEGTVEYNIRFGPRLRKVELSDAEVELLLLRAGLQPSRQLLSRSVLELSGGEAQRVSIARALANSPEVLLMDEPTSSLDPTATRRVEETISRLQHAEGLTVILVSHSMAQVERLAEVAGLLTAGKLVATGPPMELRESENPVVASFFTGEHGVE